MKYISILILLIPNLLFSQYLISGIVTDKVKKPFVNMEVRVEQIGISQFTNHKGYFEFNNVPIGEYAISFNYGFDIEYRKVVVSNQDVTYNLDIERRINFDELTIVKSKLHNFSSASSTVIDGVNLESSLTEKDIPYILENLNSVQIQSDAGNGVGYTDFRIRGIDPQHIQINLNGIPINDAESSRTYLVDIPDIINSTEQITVHTGFVPSRSGPGAFGASLDLFTNKLHFKPFAKIKTRFAAYNTSSYSLQANSGFFERAYNVELKISGLKSDGFIERASSKLKSFSLSLLKIKPNYSFRFNVLNGKETTGQAWNGLPYSYFSIDSLYRYNAAGTEKMGEPYANEIDQYSQTHLQSFYNLNFSKYTINFTGNYTRGIGYYENYKANNELAKYHLTHKDTSIADVVRQKWLDNNFVYIYAGIECPWKIGLVSSFGIANSYYKGNHYGLAIWTNLSNIEGWGNYYYDNQGTKNEFSVFLRLNQKWNAKLNTILDFQSRIVQYKIIGSDDIYGNIDLNQNGILVSPKLLINYSFSENFYVDFANSYYQREPYREDLLSNPSIKNEQLNSIDFASRYKLKNSTLGISIYRMDYHNFLAISGELNDTGDPLRVNIPTAYRQGVEFSSELKLHNRIELYWNANFSSNRARNYEKKIPVYDDYVLKRYETTKFERVNLSFSPKIMQAFGIKVHIIDNATKQYSLSFQWNSKWVGKQFLDISENPSAILPSYLSSNAKVQLRKKVKTFYIESFLQMNNVFNQRYSSHGWFTSFKVTGPIDPTFNPYLGSGLNGTEFYKGYYPQALRHLSFGLDLIF